MARRRRKKRGRPATGRDPIVPVSLPAKLLRDIDAWSSVYRDEFEGMDRSTAIRCLLLLGLGSVRLRVVDPKDKTTFEGETLPLLKFYKRGTIDRWLGKGTGTYARRKAPVAYKPRRGEQLSQKQVDAAVDRAIARSRSSGSVKV